MDFHKMFLEWSESQLCGTTIKTSAEVRCIDRSGENPMIKYTEPCGDFYEWHKQECSSIIFAFPPNIENLERAGLDITKEEYDVFANVSTIQYYSPSAFPISRIPHLQHSRRQMMVSPSQSCASTSSRMFQSPGLGARTSFRRRTPLVACSSRACRRSTRILATSTRQRRL
jgi:hypothetical protein